MPKIGLDIGCYNPRRIIPISFTDGSGGGGTPSVLQPWYDSLAVKPSAGLWTDLKIMADGMNSDGDWEEADLISLTAGLETDEQRLRPLKTTSGLDFTVGGTVILDNTGVVNPSIGDENYLNTNWNPTLHAVKYKLNDSYIGAYGDSIISNTASYSSILGLYDTSGATISISILQTRPTTTTMRTGNLNGLASTTPTVTEIQKTGLIAGAKRYYVSIKRTALNKTFSYVNGTNTSTVTISSFLVNETFIILGYRIMDQGINDSFNCNSPDKNRFSIFGSSLIDSDRVASRLNTFFASRGLSIANY